MQVLRQILVATDFSASADAAVETAIAVAKRGPARVTIVHVCKCADDGEVARGRARLETELARHLGSGVEIGSLIRTGVPVEKKINNAAAEVGATLVVVGRTGADGATELGSVTDRLVRMASRSILVVGAKELA